jgi:hypothetical protein
MAMRCTSKPVMMREARRICKSERLARQNFRGALHVWERRKPARQAECGRNEARDEQRTRRSVNFDMQLALTFGISGGAIARLSRLRAPQGEEDVKVPTGRSKPPP